MSTTLEQARTHPSQSTELKNNYPLWSPRFWHGMRFGDYVRLVSENRFRIHPARLPMAFILIGVTAFNSVMCLLQRLLYGQRIAEAELSEPPIFIVGHWRSGTTHLHELMVRDERFAYPTTYQVFVPRHFLVTEWIVPRLTGFLLPRRRPMDNMSAGFDHPQEDEFAICTMGAPTPYVRIAFPNHPPRYLELLEMANVEPKVLDRFKDALLYFVKALTVRNSKRLIMKSPPHTGRIQVLAEMFPGARFIHIVRNPYSVFPSIRRTWKALDLSQGFQIPNNEHLDEFIFDCFERMYRGFDRQFGEIDPSQICEIRYEDLVQDPLGQLQQIYEQLELGDFEQVRPMLEAYLDGQKDYRPNRHQLEDEVKAEINRRWSNYFERYGYEIEQVGSD